MTGVDADLATLREFLTAVEPTGNVELIYTSALPRVVPVRAALARVEAELSRLREERDAAIHQRGVGTEWAAELAGKLHAARDERDEWEAKALDRLRRAEAAEAMCARLQQALAGLESAVRILDVMLREPAAEGLMSAEDYRSYVQGAWLGVDEAAEKAREALAGQTSGSGSSAADLSVGERQGRQPDPGEIAGLLVELARWSRVAELNGDLHARIASALAGPDTLTAGEPGVAPDGTGRVAPADGCAERQSTADPSPAASAEPDTPADICPECAKGVHVACLDDGSSVWTDRCKCDCGDTPADSQPEESTT